MTEITVPYSCETAFLCELVFIHMLIVSGSDSICAPVGGGGGQQCAQQCVHCAIQQSVFKPCCVNTHSALSCKSFVTHVRQNVSWVSGCFSTVNKKKKKGVSILIGFNYLQIGKWAKRARYYSLFGAPVTSQKAVIVHWGGKHISMVTTL